MLVGAIAIQSAILLALNTAHNSRHVLGLPGSMIALISVLAGALAGPLVGALVAAAGGGVFYLTVGGQGSQSTVLTTVISTAVWVTAGLSPGLYRKTLSEQTERRRAAAVALVRADAAREAQLAEQARVEELADVLQLQSENLQAAGEELSAQRDELRSQNEQLSAERDENARLLERERVAVSMSAALAEVDRAIHSSLEVAQVVQTALREGAEVIGAETAGVSLHEDEARDSASPTSITIHQTGSASSYRTKTTHTASRRCAPAGRSPSMTRTTIRASWPN